MTKHTLTHSELAQFTGTTVWFRHSLAKNVHYTEGVRYVAEKGGAYWLIDLIAFGQSEALVRAEPFQLWVLKVRENRTAHFSCEDGNGKEVLSILIEYTDFPLDEIQLYYTDTVILLPSEY